ncbi:MAG: hypothetical protein HY549_07390 [Elusimicrobia bacterium]|nr:hypothetical protein [Elusimicrobiota bacterium]
MSSAAAAPAFTAEAGLRFSSAVIQGSAGAYADPMRVYFIRNSSQVLSAVTTDGINFTQDSGVRLSSLTAPALDIAISSITGLSVLPLDGGGFRMLYSVIGTTGAFRIYSATSADGFSWANDTGTRISVDSGLTFAQYPSLVELTSGDWRLYYVQNATGTLPSGRRIYTALSGNQGRDFGASAVAVDSEASYVSGARLTDGRVRLYYTAPLSGQTTHTAVLSALSSNSNGNSFSAESGVRFSTSNSGSLTYPFVMRSTESFRWRLYYHFISPSTTTADARSALTLSPEPQSLSPSTVFRINPAGSFTILGEVFSPAPAAVLTQTGQTDIAGASLSRVDDQTITVSFDTQNKALNFWNLVVTNADGVSGTLSNALFIDFPGGSVDVTDNLFRPNRGQRAKIDVTVFKTDRASVTLYTNTGERVATLLDQTLPEGTTTVYWDGRNSQGQKVASGVYLLRAVGPKINVTQKIVVIK